MSDGATLRSEGREHLAAGRVPEAVVAFRAAERLAPWDGEARADAAAVRAFVGDAAPPTSVADRIGPFDVAVIGLLATLLIVIGVSRTQTRRDRRWLGPVAAGLAALLVLGVLTWPGDRLPYAVVTAEGVVLREGNSDRFDAASPTPLRTGFELTALGSRGGWLRVRTNAGEIGWVPEWAVIPGR